MHRLAVHVAAVAVVCLLSSAAGAAGQERGRIEFENGPVFSGYNDVRIPGNTGTLFSLTDDLRADTTYYWRLRGEVHLTRRHVIGALAAPLTVTSTGSFNRPVDFMGVTFAPGAPVTGTYVFNSYRVSWRYEIVNGENWRFGLGVTGKIRDAATRLESGGVSAEKTNVGFVPLVNFVLERRLGNRATVQVAGDALAAPQGRAEDVFAGLLVSLDRRISLKAGYRLLEGGADNDEVYTFAAFHYVALGVVVKF